MLRVAWCPTIKLTRSASEGQRPIRSLAPRAIGARALAEEPAHAECADDERGGPQAVVLPPQAGRDGVDARLALIARPGEVFALGVALARGGEADDDQHNIATHRGQPGPMKGLQRV